MLGLLISFKLFYMRNEEIPTGQVLCFWDFVIQPSKRLDE